jgi:cytochrome c
MKKILVLSATIGLALSLMSCEPAGQAQTSETSGSVAKVYGDIARGQVLATKWCANCHLVDGATATDTIPPLKAIAAGPSGLPDPLRMFLTQPHAPMPPLQLSNQEIEDLIVFIQSLKPGGN